MAYEVTVSGNAARRVAGMPPAARTALAEALARLADDQWSGDPYDSRWSPEFRTIAFGGSGLATYVISERRRMVLVEHVIWTGRAVLPGDPLRLFGRMEVPVSRDRWFCVSNPG